MKKWLIFLFLVSFVSASVDVQNHSVKDFYSPEEVVAGKINVTIVGEDYDEVISSNYGDEISLGDFLVANGVDFECSPPDCSKRYGYSGVNNRKTVEVLFPKKGSAGFVLVGEDIVLRDMSMNVESSFEEGAVVPLVVEFFEKEKWEFNKFSDFFMAKDWGCYDSSVGVEGALIGPSFYCETISIKDSGTLRVGANIGGGDVGDINMAIYPDTGYYECSFNPNLESGCILSPESGEIFYGGDYEVCVGADSLTSYRIYEESEGENCGFVYDNKYEDSVGDFAIYVQTVKYADSNSFGWDNFDYEAIVDAANELIQERYLGNCSEGCVLPVIFSGVSQNVIISNIELMYTDKGKWASSNNIYDLEIEPVVVDFDGELDLSLLDFVVKKAGKFIVSLGDENLFSEMVDILPSPMIKSVFPLNPPFGVPIKFYVSIDFDGNESIEYEWIFGDNDSMKTDVPFVMHTYGKHDNYSLSLKVDAGENLINEKHFIVSTITPDAAINTTLTAKKESLSVVESHISGFPGWYGNKLLRILGISAMQADLDRLERVWNNSVRDEDLVKVAGELFELNIPVVISVNSFDVPYLMTDLEDIDIEPIEVISGGLSGATNKEYANPILTWQNQNIAGSYFEQEIVVSYFNGEDEKVMRVYEIDVLSNSNEESYFVINKPFNELFFEESVGARSVEDVTVIIFGAGESKKIKFYYEGDKPTSFFISPRLSSIILEANIDDSCNYDYVCDETAGETYNNCRTDCKPVEKAVTFLILGILLLLIIYTLMVIWYKKRYENYLFKDASQMYNLVMYVTNAQARGKNDLRVRAELRAKGWSAERVDYVIKKSHGKRTGMFEIIPISKISALWMKWSAGRREKQRVAAIKKQSVNSKQPVNNA